MKLKEFIHQIEEKFPTRILGANALKARRALVTIPADALLEVAEYLYKDQKCRFIIASGMDSKVGIEILYHFSYDPEGFVINVQVVLPHEAPEIESLTGLFEAADWIEREIHEILGVNFLHHQALKPLVSAGNWNDGEFPYRRSQNGTEPKKS
jgi:Ni,Fe-hydrogenase III component G